MRKLTAGSTGARSFGLGGVAVVATVAVASLGASCATATYAPADNEDVLVDAPDANVPTTTTSQPDAQVPVVGTVDASTPKNPDPLPDAGGCTPGAPTGPNLLANGDFDLGPGAMWGERSGDSRDIVALASSLVGFSPAPSGEYVAQLGGYSPGGGGFALDVLYQDVTVPAGSAGLTISGKIRIRTNESFGGNDTVALDIASTTGDSIESLRTWTDTTDENDDFEDFTAKSTKNYSGQTVRIRWTGKLSGSNTTWFVFNNLEVFAGRCE